MLNMKRPLMYGGLAILVFAIIFAALWSASAWIVVGVGDAVLIVDATTGTISDPILGPSAGFFVDGFKRMVRLQYPVYIYYQIDSIGMWTEWTREEQTLKEASRGEYPAIMGISKDGLEIEVDVLVRWSLNPDHLKELYMNYPNKNWKTVTIASIIREETRHTISNFTAIEVIEKRAAIEEALNQAIRQGLLGETSLVGAIVESTLEVDLRDIDPSMEFIRAIEAKLAAEQAQIQAQFEYERALILARAESESMIIVANGTREAIDTIVSITGETNSTRIAELYLTVEALKTIAPNAKNFIVVWGGGEIPIVYPIQDGA